MTIKKTALLACLTLLYPQITLANFSIIDFGAIPNDDIDDSAAFNHALQTLSENETLYIPPGNYTLCDTVYIIEKKGISLLGTKTAKLSKCPGFDGEYLMYIKNSTGLSISGINFQGLVNGGDTPNWGKQGLYLASITNSIIINNTFVNFGDAALRVTTRANSDAIESSNITVVGNTFSNCAQVTTTQATKNSNVAGAHNITFKSNEFDNCTLKLSARKKTTGAVVSGNSFKGISGTALEASYYSNISISNNQFDNIQGFLINIYPNSRAQEQVKWSNILIDNNDFNSATLGIRLQSFSDSETPSEAIQNVTVSNNRFDKVTCEGTNNAHYKKLIRTYSKHPSLSFENVRISNNTMTPDQGCDYLKIDHRDKNVVIE